jgi:hypothetical protein
MPMPRLGSIQPDQTCARAGTVTFQVRNEGEETHEFLVIRTDVEKDPLPRLPGDDGADESQLDMVGRVNPVDPGTGDQVWVDVEDGQYVLMCNLVSDGESHYLNGMYNEFEITSMAPLDTDTPAASPQATP